MRLPVAKSWSHILGPAFETAWFKRLWEWLQTEYDKGKIIYPLPIYAFRALELCPFTDVKVVILGQDPYHGKGQAHGLAFGVQSTSELPPSLKNIYRCLKSDLRIENTTGDLTYWAAQGVLLLNTILTVERGKPLSHSGKGWEKLTDTLIENLDACVRPIVWILWGAEAQKKRKLITNPNSLVIEACHPSPLSAHRGGFFFHKPFSRANKFLEKNKLTPIDWRIK